jgi:hypothetical protein
MSVSSESGPTGAIVRKTHVFRDTQAIQGMGRRAFFGEWSGGSGIPGNHPIPAFRK